MIHTLVRRLSVLLVAVLAASFGSGGATAQDKDPLAQFTKKGPCLVDVGTVGQIQVPAGYSYITQAGIPTWVKLSRNLPSPNRVGVLYPEGEAEWAIIFSYYAEGYVKDDEKDKIDADALMESMQEGEKEGNKQRKKQNLPTLTLLGWEKPPFFDDNTKALTWGLKLQSEDRPGIIDVNYQARVLGRGGNMAATLVVEQKDLAATVPTYYELLKGFAYKDGQKYSDWKPGDKVAAAGLTALIAGGAGVFAAKSGLLAKFLKPIIAGIAVVCAAIGSFFKKLFGRGNATAE
ncbi:hypothetical protein AYO44_16470 [Planctomycetaceae bacterium SCGC AG-212-F19]|nr:hypothetical protein AYO44_16470 [Planctomycetaceae bacterium SCGC AG-212-F19]